MMLSRLCQVLCCTTGLIAVTTFTANAASVDEFPPVLKDTLVCMLNVLKSTPDIDEVNLSRIDAPTGGFFASLAYRFSEETGSQSIIRFEIETHNDGGQVSYSFDTRLAGMTTPGKRPDGYYGIVDIAAKWKAQCGANVSVLNI